MACKSNYTENNQVALAIKRWIGNKVVAEDDNPTKDNIACGYVFPRDIFQRLKLVNLNI